VERDPHLVSEIGQAARAALGKVFEGWNSEVDWAIKRTIEAQIAAASLGYKPLYWDPWGEAASALVRAQYRGYSISNRSQASSRYSTNTSLPLPLSGPHLNRTGRARNNFQVRTTAV